MATSDRQGIFKRLTDLSDIASLSDSQLRVHGGLAIVFCCTLVISNVIAAKAVSVSVPAGGAGSLSLSFAASVIIYPVVYIISSIMAELYGFAPTRRTIILGFIASTFAPIFFLVAIALPGADAAQSDAFASALGTSWRILLAVYASFLAGNLLDAKVMVSMKKRLEQHLFLRCVCSAVVGQFVDSAIFISVAFFGLVSNDALVAMIIGQSLVKIVYIVVLYPVMRVVIMRLRALV